MADFFFFFSTFAAYFTVLWQTHGKREEIEGAPRVRSTRMLGHFGNTKINRVRAFDEKP
jgi:hypothetical protein